MKWKIYCAAIKKSYCRNTKFKWPSKDSNQDKRQGSQKMTRNETPTSTPEEGLTFFFVNAVLISIFVGLVGYGVFHDYIKPIFSPSNMHEEPRISGAAEAGATTQNEASTTEQRGMYANAIDVLAIIYSGQYFQHELVADTTYRGKPLNVKGEILDYGRNKKGGLIIELDGAGAGSILNVIAHVNNSEEPTFANLELHEFITLQCIGSGADISPQLSDCIILKYPSL